MFKSCAYVTIFVPHIKNSLILQFLLDFSVQTKVYYYKNKWDFLISIKETHIKFKKSVIIISHTVYMKVH